MGYPSNEPDEAPESEETAAERLVAIVENIEKSEADKRAIAGDIKEFYAEAKSLGYDTRVLRKIVALRKRDPDDVAEEVALMDLYKTALGMGEK